MQQWMLDNIEGLCTPDQPDKFTCSNQAGLLYTNSLIWGLLGSKRVLTALYPELKWCFLLGFLIAIFFLTVQKLGPVHGPRIRTKIQHVVSSNTFTFFDTTIFRLFRLLLQVNPVLIISGFSQWAPSNISYKTPGFYIAFVFMYYIRKYYLAWWEKYNYVLAAALTGATAFSAIVVFFAVQYHPRPLNWWGNTISYSGLDGTETASLHIPHRGYFGPAKGQFP
jgi:hypothetical protein